MRVVCLLPARNCAEDLPGFFESVSGLADAVVALDDGSTDQTREMLEAEPLVEALLANPRRSGYRGWDDAENRNRLLLAAKDLEPEWILFVDADERIASEDRGAFKQLVARRPERPRAYLFRVCLLTDEERGLYSPGPWFGRLFTYSPEQRLEAVRLHGVPLPTSIPRDRWYKTTVRLRHLAAMTEERRARRYRKYEEVDPQRFFQGSYEHLRAPRPVRRWTPRPPELPALLNGTYARPQPTPADEPLLSAVIISRDDGPLIEPTVASAMAQQCPFPFEVIVVVSGSGGAGEIVRRRYPQARVVELDRPALPGEARNAGLSVARGRYVAFTGSHVVIEADSFANLVRAHERGYAMVTGTMLNGTLTPAGWATYFLDNAGVLPSRPAGALKGPPIRCSYLRQALFFVGGFPEDMRAGEDTVINLLLFGLGYGAFRAPDFVLRHHSRCATVGVLVRHHFQRGRAFGRILFHDALTDGAVRQLIRFLLAHPLIRTREVRRDVRRWGPEFMWRLRLVLPLVAIAAVSAWGGLWYEVLRLCATTLVSGAPAAPRPAGLAVADPVRALDGPAQH